MKAKKTGGKRLALDSEIVRTLQGHDLDAVVGGGNEAIPRSDNGSCLSTPSSAAPLARRTPPPGGRRAAADPTPARPR